MQTYTTKFDSHPSIFISSSTGDANRQISDLKFKLVKSEQEVTALEQNVSSVLVPKQRKTCMTISMKHLTNHVPHGKREIISSILYSLGWRLLTIYIH
jgi:hypothetical protein